MTPTRKRRVVIIGGGITGLTAAYRMVSTADGTVEVVVIETDERLGGKIRTSPFVGLSIEEGPDAYLARVPHAVALTSELGLATTHPTTGHAAVWHNGLHRIPPGLLLGVPTDIVALARSGLLSLGAKARAALEPVVPNRGDPGDSIGSLIRQRFGREVHELLVDPLVGSIYAADTMQFSLDMVPQLADLAGSRSLLLAARRRLSHATTPSSPVFETPRGGLGQLIDALHSAVVSHGGTIHTGTSATAITSRRSPIPHRYVVSTQGRINQDIDCDAVLVCSPAKASAHLVQSLDPSVAAAMREWVHASVVIVTAQVHIGSTSPTGRPGDDPMAGLSGYLVPKCDQDRVTAVSFGSNKWNHWAPSDGSTIMRISLGRDGMPTNDLIHEWDDERLVRHSMDEVSHHLGLPITPVAARISRWPESFPQYRPRHRTLVESLEKRLAASAPGVFVAGASWHGIGIPACVADANHIARVTGHYLQDM